MLCIHTSPAALYCSPIAVNLLVELFKTLFALGTLVAYVGAGQAMCVWPGLTEPTAVCPQFAVLQPRARVAASCHDARTRLCCAVLCCAVLSYPPPCPTPRWLLHCLLQGTGRPGPPMYASLTSFVRDARHNRILAIPAGLYAVGARGLLFMFTAW